MRITIYGILLCIFCATPKIQGGNIVVYLGMGSYSHRTALDPYIDQLIERGHNVTFITGFPSKNPNPKVIELIPPKLLQWTEGLLGDDGINVFSFRENSQILALWMHLPQLGLEACESLYSDSIFLNWMTNPKTKVDIVVFDSLANECGYGIAAHFKAKVIGFNTGQPYPWDVEAHYGIPDESGTFPDGMLHLSPKLNFFERTLTALLPLVYKVLREYIVFPKLEQVTKKGLNLTDITSFKEIEENASLYFINSYWPVEFPRSYPPNVIPVGGISLYGASSTKRQRLPKHLEDFINKGKNGFIYVNFGTVAEFTWFKPEVRQAFIKTLDNFPDIQFIWKSTYPIKEQLPKNVIVEKWLPQKDILNHPNIKVFVTHGGLGGIYEGIFSRVPFIFFPIFAEQEYNANIITNQGYGIKLEILSVTTEELTDSISKILTDSRYKKQVEKVANLLMDRPMNPVDTAAFWTEFILKHENINEFLLPPSAKQPWWVRRQLDVWLFVFIITLGFFTILLLIAYRILKFMLKCICRVQKSKLKTN